jgi:PBP1b-binding outer membrane lipoprotein LpoB
MKTLKTFAILTLAFLMSSCASSIKFPVSTVTPAADIVFSKSHDHNGNTRVKIVAKNLAAPDRIDSHQKVYVVWIMTDKDGPRSIGVLKNKNVQTTELETLTPLRFSEVFITAEDQVEASYPSGIEISRIRF